MASSPPDDSIGRAWKLSVGANRRVVIRRDRLNSVSTPHRDRPPSSEKTENAPQDQSETDWEISKKQKKKEKDRKEKSTPIRSKTAPGKAPLRRKLPMLKADVVLLKASGNNKFPYADMLKEVKTKASPDEVGSKVGKIRKTRDGNLLIELRKDSKLEEVSGDIRKAVGDELLVRPLVPMVTIKLRDLEETTTQEGIKEALIAALSEVAPHQVEVKALRAGLRGTKAALVVAPRAIPTAKVLKPGKVRVGWINATARERKLVIRCFKCLEFGHVATECSKDIEERLCYRCGEPGHLAAGCDKP